MKIMKVITLIAISGILITACGNGDKTAEAQSPEEKKALEQDLEDKLMALKIEIMTMKQEVEKLMNAEQTDAMQKINEIEDMFISLDVDIDSLRKMNDMAWSDLQSDLINRLDRLEIHIDTTHINIKESLMAD